MMTVLKGKLNKNLHLACILMLMAAASGISNSALGQVQFSDTTNSVGGPFHIGESWGAAWGDINGDAYPDLFVSNHAMQNSVLRNNGDGTFEEIIFQADSSAVWTSVPDADIHGGSFADFDNDGDQDIFVSRSSSGARIHLMENNGHGIFEERGEYYGVGPNGGGRLSILFDHNKDGVLDMAFARNGGGLELFESNPANYKFTKKSVDVGIDGQCLRNNTGLVSDLFNTGNLYYICIRESGLPEKVFDTSTYDPNNPTTTSFTDVSNTIDSTGSITDAVLGDFNNDSKQDLFAVRGRIRPSGGQRVSSNKIEAWLSVGRLESSSKSFTFSSTGPIQINAYSRKVGAKEKTNISNYVTSGNTPTATDKPYFGTHAITLPVTLDPIDTDTHGIVSEADRNKLGIYAGYDDVNNEWTVLLTGADDDSDSVYITVEGNNLSNPIFNGINATDTALSPRLLLNNGSRLTAPATPATTITGGIGAVSCNGITTADFDNDMDLDLYMVCRNSTENISNRLYLNDGQGKFTLVSNHGGEGVVGAGIDSGAGAGEMVVSADYDVDGFIDLFVTNGNRTFPHIHLDHFTAGGPDTFIRNTSGNNGNSNHWIQIDLEGVTINRDAIGAKVFVTANGVTQYREQNGMYHRWSHDSRRIHFGLAGNTSADVRIEWPDGTVDDYPSVSADTLYKAIQSDSLTAVTPGAIPSVLAVDTNRTYEGETVSIDVSLFPASTTSVTVDYTTQDLTATAGDDYQAESGQLTFAPGEIKKTIEFSTNQDEIKEVQIITNSQGDEIRRIEETFSVVLSNASAGVTISNDSGTVHIVDDDGGALGAPSLSITGSTASESTPNTSFVITLTGTSNDPVEVAYEAHSITADFRTDFLNRSGIVVFPPNTSGSKTRYVTLVDDNINEGDETLIVRLSDPVNANISSQNGLITILDNENLPTLSINSVTTTEGDSADLTVTLSGASNQTITVDYATSSNNATAGSDYLNKSGSLIFPPGTTTKTVTFNVLQDTLSEASESIEVTLSNPSNSGIGNLFGVITIQDDDELPTISINDLEVNESQNSATLMATLSAQSGQSVIVDFETQADSATGDSDYQTQLGSLIFEPGVTQQPIDIVLIQDTLDEDTEALNVVITSAGNATVDDGIGQITILDDDEAPTVNITSNLTVAESQTANISINLSEVSGKTISVEYQTYNDSASSGLDFTGIIGTVTFLPTETTKTISVPTIQDTINEADETLIVALSNPVNVVIDQDEANITIIDDDLPPVVSIANLNVSEANGTASVTVSLSSQSSFPVSVNYESADNSAIAGVDYEAVNGVLNFGPNVTQRTIDVNLLNDNIDEVDENFRVNLRLPVNATLGQTAASVTIIDDDPTPTLLLSDVEVSENVNTADLEVKLSSPSTKTITVNYQTTNVDAVAGTDYEQTSGTITFDPFSTTQLVRVNIINDSDNERDETFSLNLSNPVNSIINNSQSIVTIMDDDDARILVDDSLIIEGRSGTVTVRLNKQVGLPVSVNYETQSSSAIEGVDYLAGSGSLTFLAGETIKNININTLTDQLVEGNETLTVTLSNAVNGIIDKPVGIITIDDDDDAPKMSIEDTSISEEKNTVRFGVRLNGPRSSLISVRYSTQNGSAKSPNDFISKSGVIQFSPGETYKTQTVRLKNDSLEEGHETFSVIINNAVNATIIKNKATITINDDETNYGWLVPIIDLLLE